MVYDADREAAACLFCASVSLHAQDGGESVVMPESMLPFEISAEQADRRFRRWSRSSWWYAEPVRRLSVKLEPMLLPVWSYDASLETHWAGLVPARNKSGSRPRSGVDHAKLHTMVPASLGVPQAELQALLPFHEGAAVRFDPELPHEVPALSERAATERARRLLIDEHRRRIMRAHKLSRCNASAVTRVRNAELSMMPIYIGSFRFRDRPWRLVINGQTGSVAGRPPLDHRKIAATIVLVALTIAAWLWLR